MHKLIISGGNGFVGKNFIELLHKQYEIVVLDKIIDSCFFNERSVKFYKYDFSDEKILQDIIKNESPDYFINLISFVNAARDLNLFDTLLEVNFKVFMKIYYSLAASESLKLFINMGSAEEYGPIPVPFQESSREKPLSPYALTKLLTTNTATMLYENYRFPVCTIRPGNLFGKYQTPVKFIPYILEELKNHRNIDMTYGEQMRDFIYINDFIMILNKILKEPEPFVGKIVNVSSGVQISLKEVVEFCKKRLNSNSKINYGAVEYRENEMMEFKCDISYLNDLLKEKVNLNPIESLQRYISEEEV